jgi:hypothetical protein
MTTPSASDLGATDQPAKPLAMRRYEVQQRVAAHRVVVGAAWVDLDAALVRNGPKLRQGVRLLRGAARFASAASTWWAVRRMRRGGIFRKAIGWIVTLRYVVRALARATRRNRLRSRALAPLV